MSQCAWGPHDDWNPYIVGPIRSTCQREIEALRNSMRTNTRATSRYDRRSGRRKKEAARCGGLVSASTMRDLFQLRRDARERRIQLCAETVDDGNNRNGNAGGNQAVFDGRGCRFILQEPNKKLRHGCALGLPSSPGQQHTRFPLSVCKLTYCKLGKANPENLNKKARNSVGTRARASTAHLGCTAQVRFCGQQKAPANPGLFLRVCLYNEAAECGRRPVAITSNPRPHSSGTAGIRPRPHDRYGRWRRRTEAAPSARLVKGRRCTRKSKLRTRMQKQSVSLCSP